MRSNIKIAIVIGSITILTVIGIVVGVVVCRDQRCTPRRQPASSEEVSNPLPGGLRGNMTMAPSITIAPTAVGTTGAENPLPTGFPTASSSVNTDAPTRIISPTQTNTVHPTLRPPNTQPSTVSPTASTTISISNPPSTIGETALPTPSSANTSPTSAPIVTPTTTQPTSVPTNTVEPTSSPTIYIPPPPLEANLSQVSMFEPTDYPFSRFGGSIALDGDFLVVGADGKDETGSAFVYRRILDSAVSGSPEWIFLQELVPEDGRNGDGFGKSVAIHGQQLIVGAPYCDPEQYEQFYSDSAGCAYIYKYKDGTWQLETKLTSTKEEEEEEDDPLSTSNSEESENFGFSVAIHGDIVVVSAPRWSYFEKGRVYIYRKNRQEQWIRIQTETSEFNTRRALCGWQVAMDANRIVVGCVQEGEGSAYVFAKTTDLVVPPGGEAIGSEITANSVYYQLEQKLVPQDPVAGWFGQAVAIHRNTVVVGRPNREGYNLQLGDSFGGAVYIFTKDAGAGEENSATAGVLWNESQILRIPNVGTDYFGMGVAVHGDNIIVGAPNGDPEDYCYDDPIEGENLRHCYGSLGIAYTFVRNSTDSTPLPRWDMVQELHETVGPNRTNDFGWAVDLQDNTVAIGIRKGRFPALGRAVIYTN